jgi:hypothetical protein
MAGAGERETEYRAATGDSGSGENRLNKKLLPLLVCPRCHGELLYARRSKELVCERDRLAFPLRNGVPVLLEMDARRLDSNDPKS